MNYREVAHRFTHIDARFVACQISLPEKLGFFTVELYPWWEHPHYLEARVAKANWGFRDLDEGAYRPVTVYPKGIRQILLSNEDEVTDWDFTQDHPHLWQYEQSREITCNAPISLDQWMQIIENVRGRLTGYNRNASLVEYISPDRVYRYGESGSFSLGQFPRPLFLALRQELDAQRVSYFAQNEPQQIELPVLFLIDGSDYIVADDFDIDVPEFTHKPEWFHTAEPSHT